MRVAAIDIGTNSVLLLIAEARGGELVPVLERATITRLGRGVDQARALDPAAVERTLACLADYAGEIARAGVTRVDAVGTSAMRDARGGDDFARRARDLLGVAPRVISGDEEASLTFAGALSGISIDGGGPAGAPVLVFDIGGGSTELIVGRAGSPPIADRAVSLDVGSVRLTERYLRSDPPLPEELDAVRADVRGELARARSILGEVPAGARLVGVAGTVTTVAAFALGVAPYDAARVHGARLDAAAIDRAVAELARLPLPERRALPAVDPARADVIVAGAVLLREVVAWSGAAPSELIASDRGVRWGLAARLG